MPPYLVGMASKREIEPAGDAAAVKSSNPPRAHHFLPEFYQRRWAGQDGRVERFMPVHGDRIEVRRVFPSQAGMQRDLYRAPGDHDDEWRAQRLEAKLFRTIDDEAAKALEVLDRDGPATREPAIRRAWTRFTRSMLHRTPKHMRATLALYEQIWRTPSRSIQEKYEALRQPWYPPTAEEFLERLNPDAVRDTSFRLFFDAMDADRLTEFIGGLDWRVFDCGDARFRLLLSDNPVVLVPLETGGGHLAMPLSPTRLLLASAKPDVIGAVAHMTPQAIVRQANMLAVERAYHCVIGSDRSQEQFVRNRFGRRRIGSLAEGFRQS